MSRSSTQNLFVSFLGIAMVGGLTACGGNSGSSGQASAAGAAGSGAVTSGGSTPGSGQVIALTPAALLGTWRQACNVESYIPVIHTITFTPTGYVSIYQAYAPDDSCTTPLFTVSVNASYSVDATAIIAPVGAEKFDSNLISTTLTPSSQAAADALNQLDFCGLTGWAIGAAKNITGLGCGAILPQVNAVDRNVLFAQTQSGVTEFFLGNEGPSGTATDGTTEARRPRSLQATSFVKQ